MASLGEEDLDEIIHDVIVCIQEDDLHAVEDALISGVISGHTIDKDGCSFLHWAAINNRIDIAKLLISHGGMVNYAGGVLGEIPLQWALRKKYYEMMVLLIESGSDMSHKSRQNNDSLHIACKLGDIRAVLILLHFGCNPNTVGEHGVTPLYWMVSTHRTLFLASIDIIRLLLRYHADPCCRDSSTGNTLLHFLALHGHHTNSVEIGTSLPNGQINSGSPFSGNMLTIAYLVHIYGGKEISLLKNNEGLTAFQLAKLCDNKKLVQFLFDMAIYLSLPPSASVYAAIMYFVASVAIYHKFGVIYGTLSCVIMWYFLARHFLQWSVVVPRHRFLYGTTIGAIISIMLMFFYRSYTVASFGSKIAFFTIFVLILFQTIKLNYFKPTSLKAWTPNEMINFVIEDCKKEFQEQPVEASGGPKSKLSSPSYKLCWVCFTVVRGSSSHNCSSTSTMPKSSHCRHCQKCIVDRDHHNPMLNNCIGDGNRQSYCFLLILAAIWSLLYAIFDLYYQYSVLCPNSRGWLFGFVAVSFCSFKVSIFDEMFFWFACAVSLSSSLALYTQFVLISHGMTLMQLIRQRGMSEKKISLRRALNNLSKFLMNESLFAWIPRSGRKNDDDDIKEEERSPLQGHDRNENIRSSMLENSSTQLFSRNSNNSSNNTNANSHHSNSTGSGSFENNGLEEASNFPRSSISNKLRSGFVGDSHLSSSNSNGRYDDGNDDSDIETGGGSGESEYWSLDEYEYTYELEDEYAPKVYMYPPSESTERECERQVSREKNETIPLKIEDRM